jgi:hypothetical protein
MCLARSNSNRNDMEALGQSRAVLAAKHKRANSNARQASATAKQQHRMLVEVALTECHKYHHQTP